MEAQFTILTAEHACSDGRQNVLSIFRGFPFTAAQNRSEIINGQSGKHDAIIMSFYFFRRCAGGFIQEIIFHQILDTRPYRPPDMVRIRNF